MLTQRPNTFMNDLSFTTDIHKTAIIFSYCEWSGYARAAHALLLGSLGEFPEIQLFLLDIDNPDVFEYFKANDMVSHGWGETYWMKDGEIIKSIKKYAGVGREELISNHRLCL